ncbi:MAG: arginine--tRNA ligase, partial [Prochlorotrichaceae cyanobacterium]
MSSPSRLPMSSPLPLLTSRFQAALVAAFGESFAQTNPLLSVASNPKFGDYQSNVALGLAKTLQSKPREVAQQIVDQLSLEDICDPPTLAGPGFINLRLKPRYLADQLLQLQNDRRLGVKTVEPQRIIVG